jgi:hypothetical protein
MRTKRASSFERWSAVPLRAIVGYGFIVYLAGLATLVLGGSGPFAMDGLLARIKSRRM